MGPWTLFFFRYFEPKYANKTHLFELVAMTTDQQKLVASRTSSLFIISTQFLAKRVLDIKSGMIYLSNGGKNFFY